MTSVIGVTLITREFGLIRFPLPQNARQVPQDVFARGPLRAALQFGFELGSGVRTYMPSAAPYAFAIALVLLADNGLMFLLGGAGFGLGRALMPLFRYISGEGDRWDTHLKRALFVLTRGGTMLCALGPVLFALR